jgi:hypothetical protein
MGTKYLTDTNAISDYLGGKLSPKALDFMDEVMDNSPAISVINRIELDIIAQKLNNLRWL